MCWCSRVKNPTSNRSSRWHSGWALLSGHATVLPLPTLCDKGTHWPLFHRAWLGMTQRPFMTVLLWNRAASCSGSGLDMESWCGQRATLKECVVKDNLCKSTIRQQIPPTYMSEHVQNQILKEVFGNAMHGSTNSFKSWVKHHLICWGRIVCISNGGGSLFLEI